MIRLVSQKIGAKGRFTTGNKLLLLLLLLLLASRKLPPLVSDLLPTMTPSTRMAKFGAERNVAKSE